MISKSQLAAAIAAVTIGATGAIAYAQGGNNVNSPSTATQGQNATTATRPGTSSTMTPSDSATTSTPASGMNTQRGSMRSTGNASTSSSSTGSGDTSSMPAPRADRN